MNVLNLITKYLHIDLFNYFDLYHNFLHTFPELFRGLMNQSRNEDLHEPTFAKYNLTFVELCWWNK